MISLTQGKIGKVYVIHSVENLPFKIKRRIYELGLLPNQKIKVVRVSLLKKAYLIEVGGYCLTLRKDIATAIKVAA